MWEYLVELFSKPAIMLTTLEQIILLAIIIVGLIIVFALFGCVVYIYETIKERKEHIDNLQQAFNQLQNDLKELKEYENI